MCSHHAGSMFRIEHEAGSAIGIDEVRSAKADDMCSPIRLKQDSSAFFHANSTYLRGNWRNRLPILLVQSSQKNQQAAHAVAPLEMRVGDDVFENRDGQEVAARDVMRALYGSANAVFPSRFGSSGLSPCAL